MKNIQPISQIWNNGQFLTATQLEVVIVFDNLQNSADFRYTLFSQENVNLYSERLTISGDDYIAWGQTSNINLAAYEWVASNLNIVIIP